MKKLIIYSYIILSPWILGAQNLLLNGSFEDISDCPDEYGQIEKAEYWSNKSGSPDAFSECSVDLILDIPGFDTEYATFELGSTYSQIGLSFPFRLRSDTIFREYMQGELQYPMNASKDYYVSFYAYSIQDNRTNHLGFHFSASDIEYFEFFPRHIDPQFEIVDWIGGYRKWKRHAGCLSGVHQAEFVLIGNFNPPGKDSIEIEGIEFSNWIYLDSFAIIEIPSTKNVDVQIATGECFVLDTFIDGFMIDSYIDGQKVTDNEICPSMSLDIEQRIRECGNLIRHIELEVIDCNCEVFVPSAININSSVPENRNFFLGFKSGCIDQVNKVSILNRWGGLMYEGDAADINLENFDLGVYVYAIEYTCRGIQKLKYGDFTLIK